MGIPAGVTLIGGGYHGKSTLLSALAQGVYNHIPGDRRECVVTADVVVLIRAEDGRFVAKTDLSPFIRGLPDGTDTRCFLSDNASGSTSQAANIVEALEVRATLLLVDEDTSATNFMIKIRASNNSLRLGKSTIVLSRIHQIAEPGQVRAIAYLLVYLAEHRQELPTAGTIAELSSSLERRIEREDMWWFLPFRYGDITAPRRFEFAAALNRLRTLRIIE